MAAKKKFKPKTFESTGKSNDVSANIYQSMIFSDAWNDLTKNQRLLYLYCKSCYYGQKDPYKKSLFKEMGMAIPKDIQPFFSLTEGSIKNYWKLYTNVNSFYSDRDALILHGFIRVVADGHTVRKANIYQFSNKWQVFGTKNFKIENKEMSTSLRRKEEKAKRLSQNWQLYN